MPALTAPLPRASASGPSFPPIRSKIELLKRHEAEGAPRRPRRPRMLVLGPTKELVEQLTKVAKSLSHTAKFSSTMLTSASSMSDQKAALAAPLDVVFATPGRLLQHNEEGNVHFGDVKWVVVDEADTMILKVRGFGAVAIRLPCCPKVCPKHAPTLRPPRSSPPPAPHACPAPGF